jgi:hypothetical protein
MLTGFPSRQQHGFVDKAGYSSLACRALIKVISDPRR